MMDLWCIIPYYTTYLCKAFDESNVSVTLGSITYHFDPEHFHRSGLKNDPGLLDVIGKLKLPNATLRRGAKFAESCLNLAALAIRFTFARPEILHVQYLQLIEVGLPFELWLLKYAKWLGIKVVYTVHNELPFDTGERHRDTYRKVYGLMDGLICHTEQMKERLLSGYGVRTEHLRVIPHGPMFQDAERPAMKDARAYLGFAESQTIVLFQGWIKPYKGVLFLLDAWREVMQQGLNAKLVIAGAGDEHLLQEIRQKTLALQIEKAVDLRLHFIELREVPYLWQAADIGVFPYHEITTSGALMTAVVYGKPIVATALPAFRELLKDGETGVLVEYGDTKGLADALADLIRDSGKRVRLGAAAERIVENLPNSWGSIADATREFYQEVL
jgi:glycosyltransferase involved in cell wall biosynthesis